MTRLRPAVSPSAVALTALVVLSACSGVQGPGLPAPPDKHALLPGSWVAPMPHQGSVPDLQAWWARTGDQVLPELIIRAQAVSPNLSSAAARLEQARAERTVGLAALGPNVDAAGSVSRGNSQFPLPLSRLSSGSITASWELDLFDRRKMALRAAEARFEGAQAQWHDARVSVAAETALQYLSVRHCEQVHALLVEDRQTLAKLAELARASSGAGLTAPGTARIATAQVASATARERQQRSLCERDIKALVALTGHPEGALRNVLSPVLGQALVAPPVFVVEALPAAVILQRPDVIQAERALIASANDFGETQAARLPRLSLSGSIGMLSIRSRELASDIDTWSIGPVRVQWPVFDGGVIDARTAAARARYDDAARQLEAAVRHAVREVEQALLETEAVRERRDQTQRSFEQMQQRHQSLVQRYRAGLAPRQEVEESARGLLDLRIALLSLDREQWIAGISLYRAAGGGWKEPLPRS